MAKLKDFDLTTLMSNLRIFEYDKEGTHIIANIFPQTHAKNIAMILESMYGSLKADDVIFTTYKAGLLSDSMLASTISDKNHDNWVHLLEITKSQYNPLWNVDGTVETTIKTDYGKNITFQNGHVVTTEQLENASTTTEYGKTETTEQITDGMTTTQHGLKTTTEQTTDGTTETTYGKTDTTTQLVDGSTTTQHGLKVTNDQTTASKDTEKISAFNSQSLVTKTETDKDAGVVETTNSGEDIVKVNDGKTEVVAGGVDSVKSNAGKIDVTNSGNDVVTQNSGKIQVGDDGKDVITTDAGKVEVTNSGNDITKESGIDTVTTVEKRGGNIGVTMTQQLLNAESDFWSQWNFFDKWFKTIVDVITIPIYEED